MRPRWGLSRGSCRLEHNQSHSLFLCSSRANNASICCYLVSCRLQWRVKKLIVVVIALVVLLLVFFVARSATPVVELPSAVTSLGQATPITVHVRDPPGIRRLQAFVEQNGARYQVFEMAQPSKSPDSTWNFTAGVKTTPQLQAGNAKLIVEATSNDLLRKTGRAERDLTVVTQPPIVSVNSEQHYLYLGMADLATFHVSGSWTEAGVRVGNEKFRAWHMPGDKPSLFSLFAFAWNMPTDTVPLVYAANGAGNDVTSPLVVVFPKKEQPKYRVHDVRQAIEEITAASKYPSRKRVLSLLSKRNPSLTSVHLTSQAIRRIREELQQITAVPATHETSEFATTS